MNASEASTSFGRSGPNPGTPDGALKSQAFSQGAGDVGAASVKSAVVASTMGVCAIDACGTASAAIANIAADSDMHLMLIALMITSLGRALCNGTRGRHAEANWPGGYPAGRVAVVIQIGEARRFLANALT